MRYSGIQQMQLDIARYARIQSCIQWDTAGYTQWIWCNMARYRDTAGYTKDTVRYRQDTGVGVKYRRGSQKYTPAEGCCICCCLLYAVSSCISLYLTAALEHGIWPKIHSRGGLILVHVSVHTQARRRRRWRAGAGGALYIHIRYHTPRITITMIHMMCIYTWHMADRHDDLASTLGHSTPTLRNTDKQAIQYVCGRQATNHKPTINAINATTQAHSEQTQSSGGLPLYQSRNPSSSVHAALRHCPRRSARRLLELVLRRVISPGARAVVWSIWIDVSPQNDAWQHRQARRRPGDGLDAEAAAGVDAMP